MDPVNAARLQQFMDGLFLRLAEHADEPEHDSSKDYHGLQVLLLHQILTELRRQNAALLDTEPPKESWQG